MGRGRYFRYTVKEPSSETRLRLAELVLTLNCFSFGGNYYKQTNGVAMGTKMGPSYANLFVGFIEHQFFSQYTVKEPSSETLLRLAELVLTLNCFSFGGNYYKQTNGVAMGTKMGPSYANLFVGFIESALPPLPERR